VGPDLHERALEPCTLNPGPPSTVQDSKVSKPDCLGEIRTPLIEVRTTYNKVAEQGIP
jgi:hypothetical protein